MRILIAPDSFKDSLPAHKVASSLARGIATVLPKAIIEALPLADGGEGTLEALAAGLQKVQCKAQNAMGQIMDSFYLWEATTQTAFIEMAQTAGLEKLPIHQRNPLHTTTFGVGEQIAHALKKGAKHIVLFVGGSATNDAGLGMVEALGFSFFDENQSRLQGVGKSLGSLHSYEAIDLPQNVAFTVATDVTNPLYGPNGAAYVYAAQKGASQKEIEELDLGLQNFNDLILKKLGLNLQDFPGAGAAGGLAAGARAFLNAQIVSAADYIFEKCRIYEKIKNADVIISGEGRIDHQTWNGKLIAKLLEAAAEKKVVLVGGGIEPDLVFPKSVVWYSAIQTEGMSLEFAKKNVENLLFIKGIEMGEVLKNLPI
jgi:glycerate 2-kinase